jgi:FkbM family methyltransferase
MNTFRSIVFIGRLVDKSGYEPFPFGNIAMTFISHSQNFEDVILWRALKHVKTGFYIDVGANDPDQFSITKSFYQLGWRGINIEPVPQWFEKLEKERPRDINLQVAAGNKKCELTLFEIPDTGLSTFLKEMAEKHEKEMGFEKIAREVSVLPLTDICLEYHTAPIHFLNIDVEGTEKQVLEGLDLSRIRPWIILLESTIPRTAIEDYESWEPILLKAGYHFVYFDGLNRFYTADEHKELTESFHAPPNCFDDFVLSESPPFSNHLVSLATQAYEAQSETQAHMRAIQNRLDECAREISSLTTNKEELTVQLSDRTAALATSQKDCIEQTARSRWLQNEWDATRERLESSIAETAAARFQAELLASQLKEKTDDLAASQADCIEQKARWLKLQEQHVRDRQQLENQLRQITDQNELLQVIQSTDKAKIDELQWSSLHWKTVSGNLENQIHAILKSRSWRITEPLRQIGILLRLLFSLPSRMAQRMAGLIKQALRPLLLKSIAFILHHRSIRQIVSRGIARIPRLHDRLRRSAQFHGLIPAPVTTPIPVASIEPEVAGISSPGDSGDLAQLSASARRIYFDLRREINRFHS